MSGGVQVFFDITANDAPLGRIVMTVSGFDFRCCSVSLVLPYSACQSSLLFARFTEKKRKR